MAIFFAGAARYIAFEKYGETESRNAFVKQVLAAIRANSRKQTARSDRLSQFIPSNAQCFTKVRLFAEKRIPNSGIVFYRTTRT